MLKRILVIITCLFTVFLSGCATVKNPDASDPWEGMNRVTFAVNDAVDTAVLKPVAKGYVAVTPNFVRAGVSNAMGNLGEPITGVNALLQGKGKDAATTLGRLTINTIFGVFGLWDVATPMGLELKDEDFGQTLGTWGIGQGPYLVLPFYGPSTIRDAFGRVGDYPLNPIQYIDSSGLRTGLSVINVVDLRSKALGGEKVLDEAALDKYTFLRDAYLQRRASRIRDGAPLKEKDESVPSQK